MTISAATLVRIRRQLRDKHPPGRLSGQAYLVLLGCGLTLGIGLCLSQVAALSWTQAASVPLTVLYANLVEYWAHRVPMHRPTRIAGLIFRGHTLQHHVFFTHAAMACDTRADFRFLLLPGYMILAITFAFIVPAGMLLSWLLGANVAYLFAATMFGYYLVYELMHAAYHQPESSPWMRLQPLRALRRRHRHHHDHRFMTAHNFNITFPIGDLLFGTFCSQDPAP